DNGAADLRHVHEVAKTIGNHLTQYAVIVNKSTVPVGTADQVKHIIATQIKERNLLITFDVASNPEFLREGDAIKDFMQSDRIIIGTESE
ncbi:UDP-glucose 6-dehydrogenase, partial [Acinetobacter baumannii]